MSVVQFLRKLKSPYNYNIGLTKLTPSELIKSKRLNRIKWLKHGYTDRFFADPFILDANASQITVLVEEKIFGQKGTIVELTIDAESMELLKRISLLELDTHLSYPFIFHEDGSTYVMPENSQAGEIKTYRYLNHKLEKFDIAIDQGVNDATFIDFGDKYYMLATKILPDCNKEVYLFQADSPFGKWQQVDVKPVVTGRHFSRPGGAFFKSEHKLYRVAQDCAGLYGNSIHIREIESFVPYKEKEYCHIKPKSYRYSKGLHTLNFHPSGLAVVDGNGYFYPMFGRLFSQFFKLYYLAKDNLDRLKFKK